jgi:hypothetical protein
VSRRTLVAVVALLAVVAGGLLVLDGGLPGGTPGVSESTTTTAGTGPGADGTTSGAATGTTGGSGIDAGGSDYAFAIERIEPCGNVCRNVTARLTNEAETAREDVRVTTRMVVDGDVIWSGNESVGTLAPGESHTSTRRVDVGFTGGLKISANDGYVTIVTVVRSEDGVARFENRRKVG